MDEFNIVCESTSQENFEENFNVYAEEIDLTNEDNGSNDPSRMIDPNDNFYVDEDGTLLPPTTSSAITITIPLKNGSYNGNTGDGSNENSKENEDSYDCVVVEEEELSSHNRQLDPNILWITNLPKNTKANELKQLLSLCGKVMCAKVVINAKYPGSCCFGYVVMDSTEDAKRVIEKLNDTEFNGQIIKIDKYGNKTEETTSNNKNETDDNNENHNDNNDKSKNDADKKRASSVDRTQHKRRSRSAERRRSNHPSTSSSSRTYQRSGVLTFDKIKEERERQRLRDRERALREDSRRRYEENLRIREIARRQRDEAERLDREREQLRMVRDEIERKKSELIKLEMERLELQNPHVYDNRTAFRRDNENKPNNSRFEQRRYDGLSPQRKYPGTSRYYKQRPDYGRTEPGSDRRRFFGLECRGAPYRDVRSEGDRRDLPRYTDRDRSLRYPSNAYERFGRSSSSIWNTNEQELGN